ncbi:hypothetical protein [Leptolyngbya sp. GGD]|nr:hypothetical protein [Leptolyngbya sp. GGD]MCY6494550.1 hypothetical protein [Leptolyngbya sp. GGD]
MDRYLLSDAVLPFERPGATFWVTDRYLTGDKNGLKPLNLLANLALDY